MIGESLYAVIGAKDYILNDNLPMLVFILRIGIRNLILFFHNVLFALIIITVISGGAFSLCQVIVIPCAALGIVLMITPYALIISLLGARFRDLGFLMPYCLQTLFYITPVVWKIKQLPHQYAWIVKFNVLATALELLRNLFFNNPVSLIDLCNVCLVAIVGWGLAIFIYNVNRNKICYWLL
jgi:lipopolysaccharide transport system permease protein